MRDMINESRLTLFTLITFMPAENTIYKEKLETIKKSAVTIS